MCMTASEGEGYSSYRERQKYKLEKPLTNGGWNVPTLRGFTSKSHAFLGKLKNKVVFFKMESMESLFGIRSVKH